MTSGLTVNSSTVIKIPAAAVLSPDLTGPDYLLKRQVCGWSVLKAHSAASQSGKPPDFLGRLAGMKVEENEG